MMPTLTIAPDPAWFGSTYAFRSLIGGVLAVVLILAVIAIAVAAGGLVFAKMSAQGAATVPQEALLRVLLGAVVAASLSGLVAWSFSFQLNLTNFDSDGMTVGMFEVNIPESIAAPDYEPCEKTASMLTTACNGF